MDVRIFNFVDYRGEMERPGWCVYNTQTRYADIRGLVTTCFRLHRDPRLTLYSSAHKYFYVLTPNVIEF